MCGLPRRRLDALCRFRRTRPEGPPAQRGRVVLPRNSGKRVAGRVTRGAVALVGEECFSARGIAVCIRRWFDELVVLGLLSQIVDVSCEVGDLLRAQVAIA